MQRRLASNGIRPINNIVDITNYVMEEYGQPMHAYDYDTMAGHEIVVRRAGADEKFVTLDGQERTMDENVLMICDGEKAVGIAGIMGGENSMITDDVKTMMFEAACFDGTNIRLSAKRIGLRTDASGKFEKGLDPNNAEDAINRACQLIEELGAGEVVGGMVDVYNEEERAGSRCRSSRTSINALLGTDVSEEDMLYYFKKIELDYDAEKTMRSLHRPSVMICSAWLTWQRRLPVSTAMTTSRPPCRKERQPPVSFRSSCGLRVSPEISLSSAVSPRA